MGYILNEKLTSTLVVWMILKRVLRPWKDWTAAKNGIISSVDGKRLRRPKSSNDREGWDVLDRLCWTLKRLYTKYTGESGLAYIFSLAYLMKEQAAIPFNLNIDSYKPELDSMTADNQLLMYEILQEIKKNDILEEKNLDKESTIIKYKNHVAKILQTIASRRNSLKKCVDIQCSDGNWNYDGYMHGMANGMILALGIFDGKDPRFLDAPKKWLGEAKQVGILYHYTSLKSALYILEQNVLKPYKEVYGVYGDSTFEYVSLTRDNHFLRLARMIRGIQCRFIIDGDKLSHNYRIEPYNDFERGYNSKPYNHRPYNDEQEERVKGSIKAIKNYIIKIQIIKNEYLLDTQIEFYIHELGKFCPVEVIDNKPYKVNMMKEDVGAAAGTANAGGNQGGVMSTLAGTPSCTVGDIAQFTPRIDMSVGKRRISRRLTYRRKRRKKRKIKLSEGKQVGILYHYTTLRSLLQIIDVDRLGQEGKPGEKRVSFTRDKNFYRHQRVGIQTEARFVIDGDRLAHNYKIQPFNFFDDTKNLDKKERARPHKGSYDEQEEVVNGPVNYLSRYVIKVQILKQVLNLEFPSDSYVTNFQIRGKILQFTEDRFLDYIRKYYEVELI